MMQTFSYKAYEHGGAIQKGDMIATNLESARLKLKNQGLIVVSVKPMAPNESVAGQLTQLVGWDKPKLADIEFWTSQMAMLLQNGIRVDRALDTAGHVVTNETLKRTTNEIRENVRSGMSLAKALGKYPAIFDQLYLSVVDIGEASGRLSEAFTELATGLGFRREMRSRTQQAMIYPLVVLVVCILAVTFIFNFVVPRFATLFSRMDDPPLATVVLLHAARLFTRYQWGALILLALLPFGLARLPRSPAIQHMVDGLTLKLPIVRNLIMTAENLRFASAMAMMLNSGVLLADALGHAVGTIGNGHIRPRLIMVKEAVKQGMKFSEAMARSEFLPKAYEGVVEVGEQAGRMGTVFRQMEGRMRKTYEQRLTNLITLIEPLMIIVMGLLVGSIVVVMLMSTISIYDIRF